MDNNKEDLILETQVRMSENLGEINSTLKFQAGQLEKHIKRTELLEERILPVEDHVKLVNALIKIFVFLAGSGLVMGLLNKLGVL